MGTLCSFCVMNETVHEEEKEDLSEFLLEFPNYSGAILKDRLLTYFLLL